MTYTHIKRLGSTNDRVTHDKVYALLPDGRILDDHNKEMRPVANIHYWRYVNLEHLTEAKAEMSDTRNYVQYLGATNTRYTYGKSYMLYAGDVISDDRGEFVKPSTNPKIWRPYTLEPLSPPAPQLPTYSPVISHPTLTPSTERKNMLNITTQLLINNTPVNNFSPEIILTHIKQETENRNALVALPDQIKANSKAIQKLIKRHTQNITTLSVALDYLVDKQQQDSTPWTFEPK